MIEEKVEELKDKTTCYADQYGKNIAKEMVDDARPLLLWIGYLSDSKRTGVADSALNGVQGALIEVIACTSLGMVRPALYAMRAEIDLLLAWWYFKDHKIEWKKVEQEGKGFMMKKELLEYLAEYTPRFREKLSILRQTRISKCNEPYQVLSAHIHCQNSFVTPEIGPFSAVVGGVKEGQELREMQGAVMEYINDVCMAVSGANWASIPEELRSSVQQRLTHGQKAVIFSG